MTITLWQLTLYAGALFILFITPGPVWVALTARALSGGFTAAVPLAVGVALGDLMWPLAAIFGLSWIVSLYGDVLGLMRWVAVAVFIVMGVQLIRHAQRDLFEQIHLDALIRAGQTSAAQQVLEMRRTYDPDGVPINRVLARVYDEAGLPVLASKARARAEQTLTGA